MALRKKGFTAKQSKRTSRHMRDSMVGSHVERGSHASRRGQNAGSVAFSNSRASTRARRGEVGHIAPSSTSGESASQYRHRVSRAHQLEEVQRKAHRRRILVGLIAVIVVVAVAVGAGFLAFKTTVGSELALKSSDAASALTAAKADEPTYVLFSVDAGAVAAPLDHVGPSIVMLARLDEKAKSLALVNIPAELQVTYGDGEQKHLYELAEKGDAALIGAVAKFADVPIAHFVKIDEQGLSNIVDALGGIEIDVSQHVDDPHAGSIYIPSGKQVLDGKSALVYLRAENLRHGVEDKLDNQLDFAAHAIEKLFADDGAVGFTARLESIDTFFNTDYSFGDISALSSWLGGMPASDIQCIRLPGYTTAETGVVSGEKTYYIGNSSDMAKIIDALDNGEEPEVSDEALAKKVDPAGVAVEVQNGTDIAGAASVTADILRQNGFKVDHVGNAEQQIYDETLVIYKGDDGKARAQAVIDALGMGRAVYASYYYQFEDDILVILGSDYRPVA